MKRVLVAALVVIVFLAFAFLAVDKSMRRGDTSIFFGAGRAILENRDPYAGVCVGVGFIYPPYFAVAMVPFAAMPRVVGASVWFLVNFASLVVLFAATLYLLERPAEGFGPWLRGKGRRLAAGKLNRAVVAAAVLTAAAWLENVTFGTINVPACALALVAVYFALRGRRVAGGVSLGAAAAPKFFLAPVGLYLLLKKKYAAVACGVLTAAALFVLPAVFLGWGRNAALTASWYENVIRPAKGAAFVYGGAYNISLTAAIYRLCVALGADEVRIVYRKFWNLNTWNWVSAALLLSPLAFSMLRGRRKGSGAAAAGDGVVDTLRLSLIVAAGLLFVPFVWTNYYVAAVLPVMAVWYAFRGRRWGAARVTATTLLVLFSVIFSVFTSSDLWGKGKEVFYHFGLITAGGLSLYAAVVVALFTPGTAGAAVKIESKE